MLMQDKYIGNKLSTLYNKLISFKQGDDFCDKDMWCIKNSVLSDFCWI